MVIPRPAMSDDKAFDGGLLPVSRTNAATKCPSTTPHRSCFPRWVLVCLAAACTFAFLGHLAPYIQYGILDKARNPAYLIRASHGAVASENRLCSNIGVDTLKLGGNAVDAAIAATFCIGVVNMYSSGLGGGGFMTVRIPPAEVGQSSQVFTIDFRETAPALSNSTMFQHNPVLAAFGGLSVGVPGEVRGLEEAHKRWGNLPWSQLIQPSVELAKGWQVDAELAKRITWFPDLMLKDPDWSSIFAPSGAFLKEGEMIRRTNLSRTLEAIAADPNAFYKGPIADSLVAKIAATGGILTNSDLENYSVVVDHALQGTYLDKTVYTTHAPTSGPVLLHMLNLMEHYDLSDGRTEVNVHRFVEAMKFGFAARTIICDPDFHDNRQRIDNISTKAYGDLMFQNITDDRTHTADYYHPEYDVKIDHGTSHTSVLDQTGMAVSITSTVNLIFGSQVLDPTTGVILNDEMDDFSTPGVPNYFGLWPSPYNYPAPGKRPLSSTTPTIVEHADGTFAIAIGGSGGSRIFPSVFQVLMNLWHMGDMDTSSAIEYGRLHDQLYPAMVDVDDVYPKHIVRGLVERGHNVTVSDINRVAAVIQVVESRNGTIYAASDSRKNGVAAGY